jgi:RecA-family ATPase
MIALTGLTEWAPTPSEWRVKMKMFKLSEAPEIPPREYLIEGLIYKGEISLLYGPSGSGKSAIIEDMFTRAAAGLAVGSLQAR